MILTGDEDKRVQKSVKAIQETFDRMLAETEYQNITVTELCSRALIDKKTFYKYYETLDDLLLEYENMYHGKFTRIMFAHDIPRELKKAVEDYFVFLENQRAGFRNVVCSSKYDSIREKMCTSFEDAWYSKANFNGMEKYKIDLIKTLFHTVCRDAYVTWANNGRKQEMQEVIDFTADLIVNGVSSVTEKN